MPNGNGSQTPPGNPEEQAPPPPPPIPAVEERLLALEAESRARQKENKPDQLLKDVTRGEYWLIRINVASFVMSIVVAVIYWGQLAQMTKATTASQNSAYAACIGAQITQRSLRQAEEANTISQSMVIATSMQAAAETESQKALLTFKPRLPSDAEARNTEPNFGLPYSIRNDGKGAAAMATIAQRAVLVRDGETLNINENNLLASVPNYYPAGEVVPPETGHPATPFIYVFDVKGEKVSSSEGYSQISSGAHVFVYGFTKYSDLAGTHMSRFCWPLTGVKLGTTTAVESQIANQEKCNAYGNRKESNVFAPPKPTQLAPEKPLPDITCEDPKN